MKNISLNILLAAVVVLFVAQAAVATPVPTPVPIPISPTPPTAPPGGVTPTPATVCTWIQVKGPGPHPFEPAPGEVILDMEIDIPGDGTGPIPVPYPEDSLGPWGPFTQYETLDSVYDPITEGGMFHEGVGHWYDGVFEEGTYIIVEWPEAGTEQTWYVHFTPEPATITLLGLGAVALIRKRKK